MSGFNLDDYVDVAERIRLFYEKYPDGRLVTIEHGQIEIGAKPFVYCKAAAYRSADDERPCNGIAWEPIPGPTPYTKDSELMNAETAAWGRAIIAAGIPSKKIASADEVQARQNPPAPKVPLAPSNSDDKKPSQSQHAKLNAMLKEAEGDPDRFGLSPNGYESWTDWCKAYVVSEFGKQSRADLTRKEMSQLIDALTTELAPF